MQQNDHDTPLHFACFRGKPDIVRLLLDRGAQVNVKNQLGETPLHLLSRGEYDSPSDGVSVAELLLERGTGVNAQDKFDWTPLHSASNNGKPEIVRALLSHAANVKAENELGETPLHLVRQGKYGSQDSVQVAQLLLDGGVNANSRDKRNWTALHSACYYGRLEIAKVLLDHSSITKSEDDQGETPLHQLSQGHYKSKEASVLVAQLLLRRGVDVNVRDKDRRTPLHVASNYGELEIVRLLLDHDADANAKDADGESPLHSVSSSTHKPQDNVHTARLLLGRGGNVNARSKKQRTPLHVASCFGKLEMTRLLLDHAAKTNTLDNLGNTPLHEVSYGRYDSEEAGIGVAQLLLARGGDVNARCETQWTPLHVASHFGKLEMTRLLLNHAAKVDAVDKFGRTPLCEVSGGEYNSEEAGIGVARLLLERGADVNVRIQNQLTPLHLASRRGKLEMTRILLDHAAKIDAMSSLGNTPLYEVILAKYECEEAGMGVARLLLERGADVNAQNKIQWAPLHATCYCGKTEMTRLLLDHAANVDAVNNDGETPLHCASRGKYDSEEAGIGVAQLLLEHGADVNTKDRWGKTPLDLASARRPKLAQLLCEHGRRPEASSSLIGFVRK